jgi:hypothetical protein
MALTPNPVPASMPSHQTLILSLISEELKSRRFFNTLHQLGLDNPHYQPRLDELILQCLGLTDESNETFDFYCAVMDEHAAQIGIKKESVEAQAKEVYEKLRERLQASDGKPQA